MTILYYYLYAILSVSVSVAEHFERERGGKQWNMSDLWEIGGGILCDQGDYPTPN